MPFYQQLLWYLPAQLKDNTKGVQALQDVCSQDQPNNVVTGSKPFKLNNPQQ